MEIVIGTRVWSSWSMRPWLVLKRLGIPFAETVVALRRDALTTAEITPHSPSGLVPVLKDGDLTLWDSLAICEHLAESFPQALLWPADPQARALARAASAEMHAGFTALRSRCPMDLEAAPSRTELSEATEANVRRIVALWRGMLQRFDGSFLAGDWSIADAFYTPVATRVRTHAIDLATYGDEDGICGAYVERLLATAEFRAWEQAALAERKLAA